MHSRYGGGPCLRVDVDLPWQSMERAASNLMSGRALLRDLVPALTSIHATGEKIGARYRTVSTQVDRWLRLT